MPSSTQVLAAAALAAGLRSEFTDQYKRMIMADHPLLDIAMRRNIPSTRIEEKYFYWESAPHVVRWIRGQGLPMGGFRGIQYQVANHDWGRGIDWHENDRQDDQTNTLIDQARDLGTSFGILDERIFFQILLNTTDLDLLPSIPNAPDGAAFFAASRFGTAAGNIITAGAWTPTADAVLVDFFDAIGRFQQFQDTEGQPLLPQEAVEREILVIYNTANQKAFREAFIQSIHLQDGTGSAGVSNIVAESRFGVRLWSTPRITDNDWFIFLGGIGNRRSTFSQIRMAPRESLGTRDNSDEARRFKTEFIGWDARKGYGLNIPYLAMHINH